MKPVKYLWGTALLAAVLLAGCAGAGTGRAAQAQVGPSPAPTATPLPTATPEPQPETVEIRFSATGDNLIHNGIYEQAAARTGGSGYDFLPCYEHVRGFYETYDVNWINQETLVTDRLAPSTYPCFSTPGQMGRDLYSLGFRVFSLSNNHSYDKGADGLASTREYWRVMPADVVTCGLYAGEEDYGNIPTQTVNGVTIAYLAYTEHTNGIPTPQDAPANVIYTNETEVMHQQIEQARGLADFVVVGLHWGVEGSHEIADLQRQLAQQLADWGADLIIGTHPHVVRGTEWFTAADGRRVFAAYSLGNFLNAQSTPDTMIGAVLGCVLRKTTMPDGEVVTELADPVLYPVINHYDPHYAAIRLYWLEDYTEELAQGHGVRREYPQFSLAYIQQVLRDNINEDQPVAWLER